MCLQSVLLWYYTQNTIIAHGNHPAPSWGHWRMQERSQEARGNKDYVESPWEDSSQELERFLALPPLEQAARERPTPELPQYLGRARKTTCTGFGMGLKVLSPLCLKPDASCTAPGSSHARTVWCNLRMHASVALRTALRR